LRHRRLVFLALGGSIVATAAQAALPLIMAWIVDNAIVARREPIWLGATLLILAGLVSFAGVYTRRYRGGQLSLDVQHDMRTELFASLEHLDGARQDQLHTGQIVSRSISDLNMVQSLLQQVPMLLGNALLFVLSISIMLWLSPLLTLVALAIAPVLWLIAIASRRKLFPASWDGQQKEAEVVGVVDGAVSGVRVVKGFGQEEQEVDRLDRAATRLYSARVRVVRLTARYTPALGAVPQFGQVGVLLLGGWLAHPILTTKRK
jgi:ATP-binding cassette subfamily B protein